MVKSKFVSLQREIFNFSPTSNNNKLRCIIARLRSMFSRPDNRGAMVHGGTKVSHKCLRAQGSQISYNVLYIKGKGCNISSHPYGQYDSPVILNENGGYQEPRVDCDEQRNWQYLLKRMITITAKYLLGSMNVEADKKSRQTRHSSKWKLKSTIFLKLCQISGTTEMDLFASRILHQLHQHLSCKINPINQGRDTWAQKFVYVFPLLHL